MADTQLDLFEQTRNDSSALKQVFGSMGAMSGGNSSFFNPVTGVGSSRDPSQYFQITSPHILTHEERIGLVEGSRICQNITQIYPMESSWGNLSFSGNRYAKTANQSIQTLFKNFKLGSLHYCFMEAAIEARLHGESYLMLGVEDGQSYDQPVNYSNILKFNWAKTFIHNQVERIKEKPDVYLVTLGRLNREDNEILIPGREEKKLEVHKDRLLKFIGDYVPPSILQKRKRHQSSLQCAFDGFALAMQGLLSTNAMMGDHSLFWYKLDGLAAMVKAKKYDEIYGRFLTLQMSKSVLKGLAMDAKTEDAGFINRNYGGVKDILETMIDYMVAETGMVRFKVLGSANRAGLGAEGRGLQDRLEHSLKIKSWQNFIWSDHILYCTKLLLLSQDSLTKGKLPSDLAVSFPIVLELNPQEIAQLIDSNLSWATKAIDAGVLNRLEVRLGIFGSVENMITPLINLDNRYTEILESDLEAQSDPELPDSDEFIDPISDPPSTSNQETLESLMNFDPESIDNGIYDHADSDSYYLIWYQGRNTSQVVQASSREEAIQKARSKGSTGSTGKIIEARQATAEEANKIRKGTWVRTRAKKYGGTSEVKKSDPFRFRPQLKDSVKDDNDSLTHWVKTNIDSVEKLLSITLESRLDIIEHDLKTNKWLLYDSNKSRVIGRFKTEEDAKRREKQINFFKRLKTDQDLQTKVDELRSDDSDNLDLPPIETSITANKKKVLIDKLTALASIKETDQVSFLASL